jgi:beta-lactam-binding protein with PASTA domain/predicted Ser/Thr protein kinase
VIQQRLGGRYDLEAQIGGGGMAVVYRAVDRLLGRTVAIKMLRPQFAGDEEFVSRFRQEAKAAARLSHPNIVSVYDVGMSDGEYYIVMEYVDGPTLKEVIRERGPLPIPEVIDITEQICDALQHAHEHGIIHRDVKPHNILLTRSGRVKVTDFGIAKAITGSTITYQTSTHVLGSVHYFSPEQARGSAANAKSDIYSLGVVMYEMLTGVLPFSGDSPVSVALKHLRERFVDPRELRPEIPQSVENIVLRCLAKSPDHRYPDMRAVRNDLRDALVHPNVPKYSPPEEITEATIPVPAVAGHGDEPRPETPAAQKPSRARRFWRGLMWTGVGTGVLCVGALAAYWIVMKLLAVQTVELPNVVGQTEQQAVATLEHAGFSENQIQREHEPNAKPQGIVFAQDPPGPTEVKENRTIILYVSTGAPSVVVPDVQGLPQDEAVTQLVNAGFSRDHIQIQYVQSDQVNAGDAVGTNPPAGQSVDPGSRITLQVSKGGMVQIPNVIGQTLATAQQMLQSAGLAVGSVYRTPYQAPDGTVYEIGRYQVGDKVPQGTPIDLYVAQNPGMGAGNGNDTGQVPPDAREKPVTVTVKYNGEGQPWQVEIIQSDAVAKDKEVVNQSITKTTRWSLTLYLTPDNPNGEVVVKVNGQVVDDRRISY